MSDTVANMPEEIGPTIVLPAGGDHTTGQLRPLRYWRELDQTRSEATATPYYGRGIYITNNADYQIERTDDGWVVLQLFAAYNTWEQIAATGLPRAVFPRRLDALEALEAAVEAIS